MIQRSIRHPGRLSVAVFLLAALLAGCGPSASAPAAPSPQTTAAPATSVAPQATAAPPATNAPPPATSVPAQPPTAAPSASGDDGTAAAQTVLDYYDAINQHTYDRAYSLWAQNGAASNQTFDQFKQGFADTVQVSIQLETPSAGAGGFSVPITLTSIVNLPNSDQQVQHFRGTYTVQPGANGWQLASASIAEAGGGPQPPADVDDPLVLLRSYYAAINNRDLARAYTYWSNDGAASKQNFTQFSQGFATTDHVVIDVGQPQSGGAAGSIYADVPAVVIATQKDGSQQTYCGTYTLRHLNVPPFDQLGWRIEQAAIASSANVQPGSDQEQRLLTNGCKL